MSELNESQSGTYWEARRNDQRRTYRLSPPLDAQTLEQLEQWCGVQPYLLRLEHTPDRTEVHLTASQDIPADPAFEQFARFMRARGYTMSVNPDSMPPQPAGTHAAGGSREAGSPSDTSSPATVMQPQQDSPDRGLFWLVVDRGSSSIRYLLEQPFSYTLNTKLQAILSPLDIHYNIETPDDGNIIAAPAGSHPDTTDQRTQALRFALENLGYHYAGTRPPDHVRLAQALLAQAHELAPKRYVTLTMTGSTLRLTLEKDPTQH